MPTVILADDHPVVRAGLRVLLETEPDLQVVGEASDGPNTVRLVEKLQCDILITDLMMPGLNGLDVARQVRHVSPQTRVVILSMYELESYVFQALAAGASAYVLKDSTSQQLVHGVREVLAGRHYLSPPLSERAIANWVEAAKGRALDDYDLLTDREREVLHLAAEGCTSAQIADRLVVSPRTVESHRASLMRKLGLHNQTDLIRYALRRGILPSDG